ncbi:MAG: WYL domain-containing protein [Firmicutes bacterium]|nr:WYL domain-containing protein [Candidatus Colivicinus equi]
MEDKKTSVIALLKILEEHSDENHILTQPELLDLLDRLYGVKLDRRTLYRNIEMLQDFGYDISTYNDNGKGYYLRDRQFEPSQINVLCNAIHSSTFIPNNSSKELINKLLATQSKYIRSDYRATVFMENKNKKENKEFFLNVEVISEAIKNRKTISFNYTKYNLNKELVDKRQEPYIISPYYMVYKGEKVFMIGKSIHHEDLTHFRVDKMKKIKITDDRYIRLAKSEDPYEYAKSKIYMYNGDDLKVAIKCDYEILDDIIDIFGKDIRLEKQDDNYFVAYVKTSMQGMAYLALQYINHMEVLEPTEVRQEIIKALKNGQKKYK